MNIALVCAIGTITAVLAILLSGSRGWVRASTNVLIGTGGAAVAAWFLAPLTNGSDPAALNLSEFVGSLFGSVFAVAAFNLVWPPRPK